MDDLSHGSQLMFEGMPPRFGSGFLKDHAGKILSDPRIAIVELVANCWDAGADLVDITWPEDFGGEICIRDNGTGMTGQEFVDRWSELSYNRCAGQDTDVIFPTRNQKSSRKAFGRNGKGRHGMFCFSNMYKVVTAKNGTEWIYQVERTESFRAPFRIIFLGSRVSDNNGVALTSTLENATLSVKALKDLIGSKFVADPSFRIKVNGDIVELQDLEHLSEIFTLDINGLGPLTIRHFDTQKTGRTSKQHGVAWWVNKRLVGEASWRGFDESPYLDARKSEAKRHTFVIEADILQDSVEADWDGFIETETFIAVSEAVKRFILVKLQELFSDIHRTRKIEAVSVNRATVRELAPGSRKMIGEFVDNIQVISPTITQKDINAIVQLLANLEKSRSQYVLLSQLAKLNSDDLDGLSELLSQWTVSEAKLVLEELGKRLQLIEALEKLVENPSSDELHQIQPLFEAGLWIFGPEYETIEFTGNRTLSSVIRDLLRDRGVSLSTPNRRPDIVVLPDSNVSIYSADSYDERSEVTGYSKILIVELKRGGFAITTTEKRQCEDYTIELRKSGKVDKRTKIVGFVLGTTIAEEAQEKSTVGDDEITVIYPKTYSVILRAAHARTFNLLDKMKRLGAESGFYSADTDPDIESVMNQPEQMEFSGTMTVEIKN